jgi:hypothetical protein
LAYKFKLIFLFLSSKAENNNKCEARVKKQEAGKVVCKNPTAIGLTIFDFLIEQ